MNISEFLCGEMCCALVPKKNDLNFPDLRGRHNHWHLSELEVRAVESSVGLREGCRVVCLFVFSTVLFNLKVDVDAADEPCL